MTLAALGRHSEQLTPLDAAFWGLDSVTAPMHVGWVAELACPAAGPRPTLQQLRAHVDARLRQVPRFRQRIALTAGGPVWVDDEHFDISHHVRRASAADLGAIADEILAAPLLSHRPLWELWIADGLDEGRVGIVGKAHHVLIDGAGAVAFMALLLDGEHAPERGAAASPAPRSPERGDAASPAPRSPERGDAASPAPRSPEPGAPRSPERGAAVLRTPRSPERGVPRLPEPGAAALRTPRSPERMRRARIGAHVLRTTALPLAPRSPLNGPLSSGRHLACAARPLEDLRTIERRFGTTINDVLLAASAGALRELLVANDRRAAPLKAMVPVSVRGAHERWGNRMVAVFPWLPCDEPDAERRLAAVHTAMGRHKRGDALAADAMLAALGHTPRPLRSALSHALSSPRLFNLTVSNVPGPAGRLSLMGCPVTRAYPAVPLAAGHRVSIGMTSIKGNACFGVFADAARAAAADRLARQIGAEIDELLARGGRADINPRDHAHEQRGSRWLSRHPSNRRSATTARRRRTTRPPAGRTRATRRSG
jgi:diacylglycerol O-acyltransferase / wax synthase